MRLAFRLLAKNMFILQLINMKMLVSAFSVGLGVLDGLSLAKAEISTPTRPRRCKRDSALWGKQIRRFRVFCGFLYLLGGFMVFKLFKNC